MDLHGMTPLLQVFDMPTSIRFYRDILGFELVADSGQGDESDWILLRRPGIELMLNTAYESDSRPVKPDTRRVKGHRDIGLFFGLEDLDSAYEEFTKRGVKLKPPKVAQYGMKQLYVNDPDGYVLCFQWPANDEWREQWRKWYGSEIVRSGMPQ